MSASLGVSALDEEAISTSALANGGEDANDADRIGVRGQLLWNVSDALDLRLILATMREDDKQISEDVTFDADGFVSGIVLPVLRAAGVSDTCMDNDAHNRRHCLRTAVHSDLEVREATLLTDYDLANGRTLSAVTSWDEYELFVTANDVAQVAAPVLRYRNTLATESFQQDVRITSAAGTSFDWLAGLFYFQSEHERGDGGDRPMWLYDELSDDPAVGALAPGVVQLSGAAAVRNARSDGHARRCAGHRLRQRVWTHDLAPRTPIRTSTRACAGRTSRKTRT